MYCWYWLADYGEVIGVDFILKHDLQIKAIDGGKAENDRIDLYEIAHLIRGGNFPLAYVQHKAMRATQNIAHTHENCHKYRGVKRSYC